LLVVALLAALVWRLGGGDGDRATAEVTRGSLAQTIETTGTVRPADPATVTSPVSGLVAQLGVWPGDAVAVGDIVAELDRAPFEAAVAEAERAVIQADLAASAAAAQTEAAQPGDLATPAQALVATQRAEEARAALDAARRALSGTTLIAPVAGTVLSVEVAEGAPVEAGSPVATINGGDRFEVAADLDEVDIPNVPVGSTVSVRVDAFPAAELGGTVAAIAPVGEPQGGGVVFPTTIALDDPTGTGLALRPGMTAAVAIPASAVEGATLVPEAAVETVGRRSFVRLLEDGEERRVEIVPGLRADGLVEVAAGEVAPGDRVLLGT
jgi:RND family efflux transporter MFP subunit